MSAKQLVEIVHLDPSTISGILQRLVLKTLLHREEDSNDRRRVRLTVPVRARRFTHQSPGTVETAVERRCLEVSRSHIRHAREVLWEIATSLEDATPETGNAATVAARA